MIKYGLLLTSLFVLPAYAASDINARLTQTELYQGGHIKNFSITALPDSSTKSNLMKSKNHVETYTGGAIFGVKINTDDNVPVGQLTYFSGTYHVYIENYSTKLKKYVVDYHICATPEDSLSCATVTDKLELMPGDYIEYSKVLRYEYSFNKPMHTKSLAMITLTPDNGVSEYGADSEAWIDAV